MELKKIQDIKTLGDTKQLPVGHYLVGWVRTNLNGEPKGLQIDVLEVLQNTQGNKNQILGNVFMFDRPDNTVVQEIYEII